MCLDAQGGHQGKAPTLFVAWCCLEVMWSWDVVGVNILSDVGTENGYMKRNTMS